MLQVCKVHVTNACLLRITGKGSCMMFYIVLYMYIQQQREFNQQHELFASDEQTANLKFKYF